MHKLIKIVAIAISVISLIFLGLLMANGDGEENAWISPLIYISYIVLFACVVLVLLFVFKNVFSNKETLKSTLIGLGLFLVVILISYILADGSEVISSNGSVLAPAGATSKWVSAGIYATFILAIAAIGTMVWGGLTKIKK
ncbi:hypothetical protein [Flavobacterium sp.]|uniref:hypothetical protein n=1 Tax=Flavobacterium sp. TaxID=239 RepID=UPI003527DE2B